MSQDLKYNTTPEGIKQAKDELEKMMDRRRFLNNERKRHDMTDTSGRLLTGAEAIKVRLAMANEINELSGKIAPLKLFLDKQEAKDPEYERNRFICEHAARLRESDGELTAKDAIGEALELAVEAELQGLAFWSV